MLISLLICFTLPQIQVGKKLPYGLGGRSIFVGQCNECLYCDRNKCSSDVVVLKNNLVKSINVTLIKLGDKNASVVLTRDESAQVMRIIHAGKKVRLIKTPLAYKLKVVEGSKRDSFLIGNDIAKKGNIYYKLNCDLEDTLDAIFAHK